MRDVDGVCGMTQCNAALATPMPVPTTISTTIVMRASERTILIVDETQHPSAAFADGLCYSPASVRNA